MKESKNAQNIEQNVEHDQDEAGGTEPSRQNPSQDFPRGDRNLGTQGRPRSWIEYRTVNFIFLPMRFFPFSSSDFHSQEGDLDFDPGDLLRVDAGSGPGPTLHLHIRADRSHDSGDSERIARLPGDHHLQQHRVRKSRNFETSIS